jgi:hypothetical protein
MKYIKSLELNEELKGHAKKMKEDGVSDEEIKKMHPEVSDEDLNEAVNASGYIKAGKLGYNDQFLGRRSLSYTLSTDLGMNPKNEFGGGDWLGFDHVSLYASGGRKTGTILNDALAGKYTYEELKKAAADFLGIKESVNENKEDFEPHMMYDPKTGKGYKADTYEDHLRMDKMGYVHEKPENIDEAKKFKPGDKWSNDFDYDGMMKYALKVNHKTPIKTLQKLHDSATDVNYHTPFSGLGNAIDWITDDGVNSQEGKDFMKQFHNDIKSEIKKMA